MLKAINLSFNSFSWDKLGMGTSILCGIHCLLLPFVLLFGVDSIPFLSEHGWFEVVVFFATFIFGIIAFTKGYLHHKQHFLIALFIAGFLLLVNGEFVDNKWMHSFFSVSGALILVYAHFFNHRLLHQPPVKKTSLNLSKKTPLHQETFF